MSLIDPTDWATVVGEVDRCLKPGGHIIIEDMGVPNPNGMYTCKVEPEGYKEFVMHAVYWPNLWLGFPSYKLIWEHISSNTRDVCYAFQKGKHWEGL